MKYLIPIALLLAGCGHYDPRNDNANDASNSRGVVVRHCPGSSDVVMRDPLTNRLILHRAWQEDHFLDASATPDQVCG